MPLLSIIIPAYNEAATVAQVVGRVEAAHLPDGFSREIIVINDGSTDQTAEALKPFEGRHTILHTENSGKGGACRRGLALCKGDFIIIQDADLEQNPNDFPELLKPVLAGSADVVFGSRFMGTYKSSSPLMAVHYGINRLFSFTTNVITGFHTTDVWTGYKMYSRRALDRLLPHLRSNGIEFELEVAVLLGKFKMRVVDVPISYVPRWYKEGKKTDWRQGARSIGKLMEFRLRKISS
jgi:glycosyltransferase involved in cell wall biosynthesis